MVDIAELHGVMVGERPIAGRGGGVEDIAGDFDVASYAGASFRVEGQCGVAAVSVESERVVVEHQRVVGVGNAVLVAIGPELALVGNAVAVAVLAGAVGDVARVEGAVVVAVVAGDLATFALTPSPLWPLHHHKRQGPSFLLPSPLSGCHRLLGSCANILCSYPANNHPFLGYAQNLLPLLGYPRQIQ